MPIELSLSPQQQLVAKDAASADIEPRGEWFALGADPAFACKWKGGAIEGGWYLLSGTLRVYRGRIYSPAFYPDYNRGYPREVDAVHIPVDVRAEDGGKTFRVLVRFGEDVTALRLDPSVVPADFDIGTLRLEKIGKGDAFREMLAGVLNGADDLADKLRVGMSVAMDAVGGLSRMADRLYKRYSAPPSSLAFSDYTIWQDFYDAIDEHRLADARDRVARLRAQPKVSVLVPTFNTQESWLIRCIESVVEQVYSNWELCIADDASTAAHVRPLLERYAAQDPRIKVRFREENGHISKASNTALGLATGEYVALLDHDDELHPLALLECVEAFERHPAWRMLFTDEDKMDEQGRRSDPYFKSDWNPDLFLSQNCVCHLTVYERSLVEQAGGFRAGYEGAQDWDLTLRVSELLSASQIGHVPLVLYHWRMIAGSTAKAPGEKSYAHLAGLRAIKSHLERTGSTAQVHEMEGYSGYFRIEYCIPEPPPLVSLLIPTKDKPELLRQCIDSILEKTAYPNYEIIVIDNNSVERETFAYFDKLRQDPRIQVVSYPRPFNYSAVNNFGAQFAKGQVLGLLNNDVEVISPRWLDEMAGHALRKEIGVVGAMLYYPNDTIQHAGVILGIGGVAGHAYVGMQRGYPGDKHRAGLAQSLSAVTAACAVMRTEVFKQVGGLDEGLQVAFNDIDLCLRVRRAGYRNLWTPFAELYHHESASRGYENTPEKIARFKREERFMKERWGDDLSADPYYNLNFTLTSTPFTLAYPPRTGVLRHAAVSDYSCTGTQQISIIDNGRAP